MPSSAAQSRAQPCFALLRRAVPLRRRGHALLPPLRLRKSTPRLRLGVRSAVDLFFPDPDPALHGNFRVRAPSSRACAAGIPLLHRTTVYPEPLVSFAVALSYPCAS